MPIQIIQNLVTLANYADDSKLCIHNTFLLLHWHYTSIMDLLHIPLPFDCSFQFLILHFMSDNTQSIHRFLDLLLPSTQMLIIEYKREYYHIIIFPERT